MHALLTPALDRQYDSVRRCLTPETAKALLGLRVDAETQARLDELADKCTEGQLSEEERAEYEAYVSALNLISLLQSMARMRLSAARDVS